jgi:hypothetical protein
VPKSQSAYWKTVATAVICLQILQATSVLAGQQAGAVSSDVSNTLPRWLPFAIPPALYEQWRKYGPWDYKEQSSKYRDFTLFNFGATGKAAGLDLNALEALTRAATPTPDNIKELDDPELLVNFTRNAVSFDKLHEMATEDSHVIRIANDFTWLDNSTKWPRDNIGFSEVRWNDYRSLFGKAALAEGIVRSEDSPGTVFFVARSRGLCTGGSSAGYAYSSDKLTPIVDSPTEALDKEARNNRSRHYAYVFKPLKANWYAFYEIDW